ncbi:MAG: hypothetical protein ABI624_07890 [Casimicrobiaceae bacterium]
MADERATMPGDAGDRGRVEGEKRRKFRDTTGTGHEERGAHRARSREIEPPAPPRAKRSRRRFRSDYIRIAFPLVIAATSVILLGAVGAFLLYLGIAT